jgi:hypothetical protein
MKKPKNGKPVYPHTPITSARENGYIAIQDLTRASDIIRSRTYDVYFPLLFVALIYLVINIIAPKYGACSLDISFSENIGTYELSVSYDGEESDALQSAADKLSVTVARNSAKQIHHEYIDGRNAVTASL